MAKIQVDYDEMSREANEMREYGKQLNGELTKAYLSIAEMHNHWYGKRYNELEKSFNNIILQLNEMLTIVVTEVPYALETIANNYSQADSGQKVTVARKEEPNKLTDLAISNDVGMRFITSSVSATQQSISTNFRNAKDLMDKIETVYAKLQWQGEASDAFKNKFRKLKNEIVTSFENINTQFTKLMQQTQQDIENAENANNVN